MNTKNQNKRISQKLDNKGSALIGALFAILMLGYFGATVAEMGASDTTASNNQMDGTSALYIGQAGLEYAKDQLYNGNSPDVADKAFSDGSFTITSDSTTGAVTVVSNRGNGERTQMITTDFSDDRTALSTDGVTADDDTLNGIELVKSGDGLAIVDKITIDWNWESCDGSDDEGDDDGDDEDGDEDGDDDDDESDAPSSACDTDSDGNVDYDDFADPDHEGKIFICHVAANGNENTLSIAVSGWEGGHDGHEEDYLGECGSGGDTCELSDDDGDDGDSDGDEEGDDDDDDDGDDDDDDDGDDEDGDDGEDGDDEEDGCADENEESGTVEVITLDGNTIYNGDGSIGTPLFGAGDSEEIDATDTILATNGTHTLAIQFNTTIAASGSYQITVTFADGSTVTSSFVLP